MSNQVKSLDALTGLRFIAAFAVFVHHVSGKFGLPEARYALGALAVSFFFVLSGFILTYVYHNRLTLKNVKKFYFTRWARIWPLHFVCLIIALFTLNWDALWARDPQYWQKMLAAFFLLQSWVPNSDWVFAVNGVSWSISTEMFFYFMFPLFLIGGQKKFWIKYVCLLVFMLLLIPGITAFSHSSWASNIDFSRVGHNNPLLRLPEFCTGMAIGYIYLNRSQVNTEKKRRIWLDSFLEVFALGLIVLYAGMVAYTGINGIISRASWGGEFLSSWFRFTSGCLVFASVIYIFSSTQGAVSRFLSTRMMVFLGEISFAFYMIHMIVIRFVLSHSRFYDGISPYAVAGCIAAIAIAMSTLLFLLVEMPCKNGLLAMYEGKFKKGLAVFPTAGFKFVKSPSFALFVAFMVIPMTILAYTPLKPNSVSEINKIVRNTDPKMRNVEFGHSVALLGYEVNPLKGGWEVKFAWQKIGDVERNRVVHVCDEEGNVVASNPREKEIFENAKIGEKFVDRVLILRRKLSTGARVSVGFHEVGKGMSKVNKGPRLLNNRKLEIITQEQYTEIAQASEKRFGVRIASKPNESENR